MSVTAYLAAGITAVSFKVERNPFRAPLDVVMEGSVVAYHGSMREEHGRYRVLGRCDCAHCENEVGPRFVIRGLDPYEQALLHVGRNSITAVPEGPARPKCDVCGTHDVAHALTWTPERIGDPRWPNAVVVCRFDFNPVFNGLCDDGQVPDVADLAPIRPPVAA